MSDITIGIDLGTTNSCVAFNDGHGTQVIDINGAPTLQSVVAETQDGKLLVGELALRRIVRDTSFVFSNVKRHIGRAFIEGEDYGPQIAPGPDGQRWFRGRSGLIPAAQLAAEILKVLKQVAERRIGRKANAAVIAVPANFDNEQVLATQEAGRLAGFRKVTVISEPEAAVLAYGLNRQDFQRVLVFDKGGGTLDTVVASTGRNLFTVEGKDGNDHHGGIDYDARIRARMIDWYREQYGRDLSEEPLSLLRMAPAAEAAKKDLTGAEETTVEATGVAMDRAEMMMRDVLFDLTRAEFETMTEHLTAESMAIVQRTLDKAKRVPGEIDEVLLVGGMTRVPAVRAALAAMFGEKKLRDSVPADLVVAIGAAIKAAQLDRRLPVQMKAEEITAHAFGLETESGEFAQILPAGSRYEAFAEVIVTTTQDGQDVIPLRVLQGGDLVARKNTVLARYDHRVAPGPARSQSVKVEYLLDDRGILMVAGRDLDTGAVFNVLEGSK